MKGIIFNLLDEVISAEHGPDAWDDLLDAAGVDGVYTAPGNYPDEEFVALLHELPAAFGTGVHEQLRWFGRSAMPLLAERYGTFFEQPDSTASFLRSTSIRCPASRPAGRGGDGLQLGAAAVCAGGGLHRGCGRAVRRGGDDRAAALHASRRREVRAGLHLRAGRIRPAAMAQPDEPGTIRRLERRLERELPIHVLKIDRSFTAGLGSDRANGAIVGAVAGLAGALDLRTVAEGVETPAQLDILREIGCDHAQGYLFGRPQPAEQAERLLGLARAA